MDNNGYVSDEKGLPYTISKYVPEASFSDADLVEIHSRASIFKRTSFYKKFAAALFVFLIIILIGFIVLACLYSKRVKKYKLCTTEECLRSAANLRLSIDPSINPCEDFYKFSCGRWSNEHLNHGWYPKFSNFEAIYERITLSALKFLKENSSMTDLQPIRQSRDFYKSCMNIGAINKLGFSSLLKYLEKTNLPVIPHFFSSTKDEDAFKFDWIKVDVAIKKLFAMDLFIGVTVDANRYDRKNNVIYLGIPGQSCPLPSPFRQKHKRVGNKITVNVDEDDYDDEYDDDNDELEEFSQRRQKARRNTIIYVVKSIMANLSLNIDNSTVNEAADVILNVTNGLGNLLNNESFENIEIESFKVEQIQNTTDEYLIENGEEPFSIWKEYLNLLFENTNITLDLEGNDLVYMATPIEILYLRNIALFLKQTRDIYIELYMWWVTVYTMIINTSRDVVEYIEKQKAPFRSTKLITSRSLECASIVTNFMGMAISYGIADRMFMKNTKPKVERMLRDIKEAFIESVNEIEWMDEDTKMETLKKTEAMISFIGFPNWLFASGALEKYYSGVHVHKSKFLDNMMGFVKMYIPYKLSSLRRRNRRTWKADPIDVNAYNLFADNSITVPMAILSFPMYHLGLEVLNYGAIGSILGHELIHGFDNTGRKYDKYGNYVEWWSNKTVETFEEKTKCFIEQYENYTLPHIDEHVDGKSTLGENLADNGGLRNAYKAYQNYLKQHDEEPHLPGFEKYTNNQLFFIAFGNIWCETSSPEMIKTQIMMDEHAPNIVRVLGTLQNSNEFAEAFKCPIKSAMNPERPKCRIW